MKTWGESSHNGELGKAVGALTEAVFQGAPVTNSTVNYS